MAEPNSYEEQRRRQVEETSGSWRSCACTASPSPSAPKATKLPRRCRDAPTRRSGRVAGLPEQPDYRGRKIRGGAYVQRRQLPPDDVYATDEASAYALTKAEELKSQLCSDHPSFVKPICYKTATASCLRIPQLFKEWYLPWCNEMIYLVDEQDVEFHLPYHALSGSIGTGWKMFAIGHNLADGDCLVFQQVQKTKFKSKFLLRKGPLLTPLASTIATTTVPCRMEIYDWSEDQWELCCPEV
ncbi:B3 domain-containing protein Os06g0194400-like isoform X2 [Triticum urartu]|uniref:B3 domain-containing protein Os06g0194400-like isoform X2 n=1 Tax=Triticum urartu TaxID=4572 RepID=UPI002042FDE9|nr:B3 domain-containing protein Os06g0194400-like isoform X2 [Triticum urartu]